MKDFLQWLAERGARTCLGNYPPLYGVQQKPPLAFAPTSATTSLAFATLHGDVNRDILSPDIKKQFDKNKKRKKQPQVEK